MGTPVISSNNAPITPVIINSASIISNRQDGVLRLSTPRGVTGTVFVTVRALATNRTSATGKIAVNIISNTVNDATFLGPLPHSLITTQIAGAVMAPFRVFDIDGDQPSLALEDLATGQFPTSFSATIDDLNRLWLFPVTGFTGTVNMVLGAKDATHNYDTHKFSVTVLPAPDSPTLYILPRTGMLYAPTNALGSKFNVSGRCVLTNGSDHAFSSNDVVKVTFGGGTNTLNLVLRPDDLALKLRSGILSYRSKVGVKPSIYLNFNSRLGLFNLMLAGFDFSQPQTNDVQVSIQIGNDYGSDTRTWTNRLGRFYPPRP